MSKAEQSTSNGEVADVNSPFALAPQDIKRLSRDEKVAILREMRLRPVRRPTVALMLATDVLAAGTSGLGDELWSITEQCLIAALECGKHDHAGNCLKTLTKKFGQKSVRVRKLAGLCAEAADEEEKAKKIYEAILADSPGDQFVVRRQVAFCKASNDIQGAIDVLEKRVCYYDDDKKPLKYQEVHALDIAAFKELANLYLQIGSTDKAIFYIEECLLCDPFDYAMHARHGEVAYAKDQYDRAIAAFSQSIRLNDASNNTRAAYGLYLAATKALAASKKGTRSGDGKSGSDVNKGAATNNSTNNTVASPDGTIADYKQIAAAAQSHLARMYGGSANAHLLDMMLRGSK